MNEIQSNEEMQVIRDWECNWSANQILQMLTRLAQSQEDGEPCSKWMMTARAQDLFNVAAILASEQSGAKNYLDGAEMFNAKLDYCIGNHMIMYRAKKEAESQEVIDQLFANYGRPENQQPTIRYYVDNIMDKQGLRGLNTSADILAGCDRYLSHLIVTGASRISDGLVLAHDQIIEAFAGDFVRTYALIAMIDVVGTVYRRKHNGLRMTLLSHVGVLRSR